MSSLFAISQQYQALAHKLADLDFDATTIADTLEASGIVDDLTTKASNIEHVARGAEAYLPAIDAEIDRLQALRAHRSKIAAGLRAYLLENMQRLEIEHIDCPLFSITIRKNPPSVDVFDPLSLPAQYMVIPAPKPPVAAPDKKSIAAAIKSGVEIPGARLVQGVRLNIE